MILINTDNPAVIPFCMLFLGVGRIFDLCDEENPCDGIKVCELKTTLG